MTAPPSDRRSGRPALRRRLLDVAEELLAETADEDALTVRAVTGRAGVTPPSLYLHFADKDDLVRQIVARGYADLARATAAAAEPHAEAGDPAAALRCGARAYLVWAQENPGRYAVLFTARRATRLERPDGTVGSPAFDGLVAAVQWCHEEGVAPPGDAWQQATLVWAALHGLATLRSLHDRFDWPPSEALVDDLLAGVVGIDASAAPGACDAGERGGSAVSAPGGSGA